MVSGLPPSGLYPLQMLQPSKVSAVVCLLPLSFSPDITGYVITLVANDL